MSGEAYALILSIISTVVALVSTYLSQMKKGKIVVPPIRAYRLQPLNFHVESESYRAVSMMMPLTFMNTGARSQAVHDLRVQIPIPEKSQDLVLQWENEYTSLSSEDGHYATQPTLGPYASISCVYNFKNASLPEQGKLVSHVEETCEKDANKFYRAHVQIRTSANSWCTLRTFAFRHSGRVYWENDFNKINNI